MEKLKKVAITCLLLVGFISVTMAQNKKNRKNKKLEGEIRVITVESENGKTTKSDKTYSLKDKEKVEKMLREQGVDLNLDVKNGKVEVNVDDETDGTKSEKIMIKTVGEDGNSFAIGNSVKVITLKEGENVVEGDDVEVIVEELEGKEGRRIKIQSKRGGDIDEETYLKQEGDIEIIIEDDGEIKITNAKEMNFVFDDEMERIDELKVMTFIRKNSDETETDLPKSITETFNGEASLKNLNLFPNPSNGNFKMRFTSDKAADYDLDIVDSKGAKIFEKSLKGFEGEFNEDFDLSKHEAGIYFFNLRSKDQTLSKKIVVQ